MVAGFDGGGKEEGMYAVGLLAIVQPSAYHRVPAAHLRPGAPGGWRSSIMVSSVRRPVGGGRPFLSLSPREEFAFFVSRVVLKAVGDLVAAHGTAGTRRRIVNYLRGSAPPDVPTSQTLPADTAYGLLWATSAAWVEEIIERLSEEGYIEFFPPPRGRGRLTPAGERCLDGSERGGISSLPERPRLGSHPELEERLRQVRRRLARETGRPPFGIFSNATLAYLAAQQPQNLGELAATPGLGERRLRAFGRRILSALRKETTPRSPR